MKKILSCVLASLTIASILAGCVKSPAEENNTINKPKEYQHNPLTGEKQLKDYPMGQRPVAIMVNNIMSSDSYQSAWPQKGMSSADVVFEMETEGGITRYMAIYRDWTKIPVVGPIRSARDQFVQLMLPYDCLYVHDGGSSYAKEMLAKYNYENKDLQPNKNIAFRDLTEYNKGLKAKEHTEFTSGQLITETIESGKFDIDWKKEPQNLFNWVNYDEPLRNLDGDDATTIEWDFSQLYAAKMTYHPETNKYTKDHINLTSRFSKPLIDAGNNDIDVEFDNVFLLWTQIEKYPDGVLSNVSLSWGGVGYYFNGGKVEKVRWLKGSPNDPLRIVSLDGSEEDIKINIGKSYISFVDLDYFGSFAINEQLVDVNNDYKPVEEGLSDSGDFGIESTDE